MKVVQRIKKIPGKRCTILKTIKRLKIMEYLFLSQIIMYKTWKINRKSTKILRKPQAFYGLSLYKIITKM